MYNNQKKGDKNMLEQYNDVITINELCEILLIGRNAAYKLLNSNAFGEGAFRIGNRWKITKRAVCSFLYHKELSQ